MTNDSVDAYEVTPLVFHMGANGASNAAGGTLISTGNNLVIGNGSNVAGGLTRVGMQ